MPKLWDETIDAHRRAVRDATLDAAATLVAEGGLRAVTMSGVAQQTGIGRATLYKYFPDVESILAAWHERQIRGHLQHLSEVGKAAGGPGQKLADVLEAYALMRYQGGHAHGDEMVALLHRGEHVTDAHRQLHAFVRDLIADAAATEDLRDDVPPDELAAFSLQALDMASRLPSKAAVRRIVAVTLAGLRADP